MAKCTRRFLEWRRSRLTNRLRKRWDFPRKKDCWCRPPRVAGRLLPPGSKAGITWRKRGCGGFIPGGDGLTPVDGMKVSNPLDVNLALNKKRPGDTVTVSLFRGGKKMDISVKLGERPGN